MLIGVLIIACILLMFIIGVGYEIVLNEIIDLKTNHEKFILDFSRNLTEFNKSLKEIELNKELKEYNESQLAYDLENIKEELTKTIKDESNRTIHTIAVTPLKVTQIK